MESFECKECSYFIFKMITPTGETVSSCLLYMYQNLLSLPRPDFQLICLFGKAFGESEKFQTALKLFLRHSCMPLFSNLYANYLTCLKFLYKMLSRILMKSVVFKLSALRDKKFSVGHLYSEQNRIVRKIVAELITAKSTVHNIIKELKETETIDNDQRVGSSSRN